MNLRAEHRPLTSNMFCHFQTELHSLNTETWYSLFLLMSFFLGLQVNENRLTFKERSSSFVGEICNEGILYVLAVINATKKSSQFLLLIDETLHKTQIE